ncbi:MAG: TIGR03936 family radical SAM-associated protein [Phycisphaerae bacterium]|nr:TIGR03936 family radical SAM-associated protein [Phycisphaerae bacterium]
MRFASHRDMMRAAARLVRRAGLPVRYSQGFNPHPILSLPCPRPVGVASRDEMLVVALAPPPPPAQAATWTARLGRTAPHEMDVVAAAPLPHGRTPHPLSATYEMPLAASERPGVRRRVERLDGRRHWPAERAVRRGTKRLDLRRLVNILHADGGMLRWRLIPDNDIWARPAEVLRLVGLDENTELGRVVRTEVDYGLQDTGAAGWRANGN